MVACYMIAAKYLNYVTPMYESTTKIKLADISEGITNSNLFKDFDVFATSNKVAGEIEVLKSEVLLNQALDQLNFDVETFRVGKIRQVELYEDNPFKFHFINFNPSYKDRLLSFSFNKDQKISFNYADGSSESGNLSDTLQTRFGSVKVELDSAVLRRFPVINLYDNYGLKVRSRPKLISDVKKNLDVTAVDKDVAVIRIIYKSANPNKAAVFASTLADVYIHDYIDVKYKVANTTSEFLKSQIEQINKKLQTSENEIEKYRNNKGITNIIQETETELRKISQLKIQQTNLKMSLSAIKTLEEYIAEGKDDFLNLAPNFEAFTDLLSTEIVKSIKALQAKKKELLMIYTADAEEVKIIDAKIEDLKNYLIESISNTRKNLEVKYELLTKDIIEAEKVFLKVPENEKVLATLNREFRIYEQSYNFLNEKKIEAEIARAATIAFHRVISPATVPNVPVSPNRTIIKIVSALLGLFGAIALIFVVHMLKARVNNRDNIESNSLIPVVMETPKFKSRDLEVKHFQRVLTHLEIKGLLKDHNVMNFTHFKKNEGAEYNAFNLAYTLANQGKKVLIIDVLDSLSDRRRANLNELINGEIAIQQVDIQEFRLYSNADAKNWLVSKSQSFDYTIIINDYLTERDGMLLMAISDLNFISLDARLTLASKIEEANLIVDEYKLPNVHFILNRAHYNPNIVLEAYWYLRKFFIALKGRFYEKA